MRKYLILAVFLLSGLAHNAEAATYYVDFNNGNDASAGTATTTAWQRFPGMTNELVAPSLSSGDVVCMKGGVTWVDRMVPVSGVSYKGNCTGWGSGSAVIAVASSSAVLGALVAISTDNWSIEAIVFSNENKNQTYHGAAYIEGTSGDSVTNIRITNCGFNNSGQGLMLRQYTSGVVASGITAYNNTYVTISGVSSGVLISGPGTNNIQILGSTSSPTNIFENGRYAVVSGLSEGRGITVGDNVATVTISGVNVYDNGEYAGEEGTQLEGGISDTVTVTNSFFDGNTGAEIKKGANNWKIVGNIFRGTSAGIFQYGYESPNHSSSSTIANNLIISRRNTTNAAMKLSSPGNGMSVRNNIVVVPPGFSASAIEMNRSNTSWAMSTWDNNISNNSVYRGPTAIIEVAPGPVYTNRTLAQHRSAYPAQASGGTESNPSFRGGDSISTTNDKNAFRLSPDSPLIGAGIGIGSYTDLGGRSYNYKPSIGAWEYGSGDFSTVRPWAI